MRIISNQEPGGRLGAVRVTYVKDIGGYQILNNQEGHELMARVPGGEWIVLARKGSLDECLRIQASIDEGEKQGSPEMDLRVTFPDKSERTFAPGKKGGLK